MSELKDQNKNYRTIKIKLIQKVFELASLLVNEKNFESNWDDFIDFIMQADEYDHKRNATFKTYLYRYLDYFNKDNLKKNKRDLIYLDELDYVADTNNDFDFIFDDEVTKLPLLVQQARLIRPLKDYIKTKDKQKRDTFFSLIFTNDCIGIVKYLFKNDNKNSYCEIKIFQDELMASFYKIYINEILKDEPKTIDKIAINDFYEYVTISKSKDGVDGLFLDDTNMAWHLAKIDDGTIDLYDKENLSIELKKIVNSKKVTITYHRKKLKKLFLELLRV